MALILAASGSAWGAYSGALTDSASVGRQHPLHLLDEHTRFSPEIRPGLPLPRESFRFIPEGLTVRVDSGLFVSLLQTLDSMRTFYGVTGMSAAMHIPGTGLWEGVTGYSSLFPYDTIHSNMIFCIASNTKTFVATLVLKLAEQGILSLDDSLGRWLPPYPNVPRGATLRQLLSMTSGIFDYLNDSPAASDSIVANPERLWSPEEVVTTFVGPPWFPPGGGWRYSNTNTILLGMVIRAATGSQVGAQLHNRIITPLQLQRTFLEIEDTLVGPIAEPWYAGSNFSSFPRGALYSMAWTAGAMFSTSGNLAQWASSLYGGGMLTPGSLSEMLTFVPVPGNLPGGLVHTGYGLAVSRLTLQGRVIYSHGGHLPGYLSEVTYFQRTGASLSLLINQSPSAPLYETIAAMWNTYMRSLPIPSAQRNVMYATFQSSQGGRFGSVNLSNGAALNLGPTDYESVVSLAIHPATRQLIGLTGTQLVRVDVNNGGAYPYATVPLASARGMAFKGDTLYIGTITGALYRVGLPGGDTIRVAETGIPISGLAFHPITGELWASVRSPISGRDRIYKVHLPTGLTTLVGTTGFNQITQDIAFDGAGTLYGIVGSTLIRIDTASAGGTPVGLMGIGNPLALALLPDSIVLAVDEPLGDSPFTFALEQAYPNPFNAGTVIRFSIPNSGHVTLKIFDLLGKEVDTPVDAVLSSGGHEIRYDRLTGATGIYFYRLTFEGSERTRKMVIIR